MDFQASYGGIPLTIDPPEAHQFIDKSINLNDVRVTTSWADWPGPGLVGLTFPNKTFSRPKLRIGSTFYPTGAARWTESHWLATQDQYDLIVPLAFNGNVPVANTFLLQQGDNEVSTQLYLLPPRVLGKFGGQPGMWLLSFVDERYYWQYMNGGNLVVNNTTTWTTLITTLASALGISLDLPAVNSVYLQPSPYSDLYSRYESASLLLDAALLNVGYVLVRNLDGTYAAQTYPDAQTVDDNQQPDYLLAGGDMSATALTNGNLNNTLTAVLPASVTVTFPKVVIGTGVYPNAQAGHIPFPQTKGDVYALETTISQAGFCGDYCGCPGSKIFHDTCPAYVYLPTDTVPINQADLMGLAMELSVDFYNGQLASIDEVIPGIFEWSPECANDLIWMWSAHECWTRIQRKPWNFGVTEMLHYEPSPSSASSSSGISSSSSLKSSSSSVPSSSSSSVVSSSSTSSLTPSLSSSSSSATSSPSSSSGQSSGSSCSATSANPSACNGLWLCDVECSNGGLMKFYDLPTPIGTCFLCAAEYIPENYLLCDGTIYSGTDFPLLYAAIGNNTPGCGYFQVPTIPDQNNCTWIVRGW
jgi:hypothetical protein